MYRSEDAPAQERLDRRRGPTAGTHGPTDTTGEHADDVGAAPLTLELGPPSPVPRALGPLLVLRTPRLIRGSDPELYQLALPVRGCHRVTHAGRDTVLGAGEMVLHDGSRPLHSVAAAPQGSAELIQVQIPKARLPLSPGSVDRLVGRRLSGRDGIGALLSGFLTGLVRDADRYRPADTARLGGVLLDLLTALLVHALEAERSAPSESHRRALMLRVQGFIERHLGDARLSPQAIAAAHQISTRSLYKLFQEEGLTVAAWVRERRLENCRRALADPALNSRPVHAIAARWGFTDSAHFSRAFRAAYGMPPKEYRRLTRLGADVREPSRSVQGQSTTS
ncbi:helix-turn-helix domain-containing protein [Streptomyces sp. NPDC126497]|uniref:helix-turn-helix domain-containing protein n=1 Tax=Streptomyces sp. NPDC126497 TaxID=3155313 RepID=UPI00331DD43D